MIYPYALLADIHCHDWSQFATVGEDGVNTRLRVTLDEILRAAEEVKKAGGITMFLAGDIFHVRGKVKPSVLNPVLDTFKAVRDMGVDVYGIPGNHDLENNESDGLGNAARALNDNGAHIFDKPGIVEDNILLVPWHSTLKGLIEAIEEAAGDRDRSQIDLVIHAPVNGVLVGVPDAGFSPEELEELGFKRVFVGHFHNHMDFGNGVYSIGATTHQTWNDVGTKAGFLIVDENEVRSYASHAPKFLDFEKIVADDEAELELAIRGNYVRCTLDDVEHKEIEETRKEIFDMGAKGVIMRATKKAKTARTGSTVAAGASLETSVSDYVKGQSFDHQAETADECTSILTEARSE